MNGNYLALAGRIRQELKEVAQVVERTEKIWQHAQHATDDYHVDAAALNMHGFYAGIERVLEMIADTVDQSKPSDANWHQEILRQMTAEIPGVRPAVLSTDARNKLDIYRGFRHVVRNVYTFNIDPAQVELLVQNLQNTMQIASAELLQFADTLEEIADGT